LNLCCVGFFGPCTKYPECVINIGPRANISIGTSCRRFQNSVMQKLLSIHVLFTVLHENGFNSLLFGFVHFILFLHKSFEIKLKLLSTF
jgi:hypothetical protein